MNHLGPVDCRAYTASEGNYSPRFEAHWMALGLRFRSHEQRHEDDALTIKQDYSAQGVVEHIRSTLQSYLEAQYHIRDISLLEERKKLFEQAGVIYQEPYVEATPVYEVGPSYA